MSKQFLAIIAAIVVVLGAIFIFNGKDDKSSTSNSGDTKPTSHIIGSTSTGVKLQEYGDYQCPYCAQFHPVVKQVIEQYKDRIQFQFSNLPLNQVHRNAFAAARAAEAAGMQGKFWEMHDLLYQNQDPQGASGWVADQGDVLNNYFVKFAESAGVPDTEKFKKDFASRSVNSMINADIAAFKETGLEQSTPVFILNGKRIQPTYDIKSFEKLIDAEIKKQAGN